LETPREKSDREVRKEELESVSKRETTRVPVKEAARLKAPREPGNATR